MKNRDSVIGPSVNIALNTSHFDLGRKHNQATAVRPSNVLGAISQSLDLDMDFTSVNDDGISLVRDISRGYFLDPSIHQGIALPHGVVGEEYHNGYDQDGKLEGKYEYDKLNQNALHASEQGDLVIDEVNSGLGNHDRPLTLTPHDDELCFSENNENVEGLVLRDPNLCVKQHQLVIDLPIVQSRNMTLVSAHELSVGQEFPDVKSCRRALRDMAIAGHFEIQTVKSDKARFTTKCASEGCPWRVHAAKLPGVPTFTIRTIHSEHICGGISHLGHQQASAQWVASSVEKHLMENPHYQPKEIVEEIHRVYGITLSYKQAWRGKERFMASFRGSFEEDYRLLPQYCKQFKQANPGSVTSICVNPVDNSFLRLFISHWASIYGFLNACRRLVGIDRAILRNKYLGIMLLATGFDGDGMLFPLAFGVVDKESDENWMWFLSELHNLLELNTENMPRLTFLSNRQKSIIDAVESNFPTAFHGFCMLHLSRSLRKEFNNSVLVNLLWEAANALTVDEFDAKIMDIKEVSHDAAYWVLGIPAQLWAASHFEGVRFGHMTSNIMDTLNSWILEASGLPIVQMLECIRRQLMIWFNERREASMQWTSTLVPSAERSLSEALDRSSTHQVLRVNESEFEVISNEGANIVDILNRHCLCRGWQLHGIPCSHAVAALASCGQNVQQFTESCFTVATYRKAYSQTIHPVPDRAQWQEISGGHGNESCEEDIVVKAPAALRPIGQPRKRRRNGGERGLDLAKRVMRCSRCSQTGHFRTTCPTPT